ncbi:MAG: DUF4432 family protein [Rhodospirillaceae bacterium]|nr:DUF4432 family protein [Rhodospirillaceae bacterium]
MPDVPDPAVVHLRPAQFGEAETVLATCGGLTASTFRYPSGVAALRIENRDGHIVVLPFQGQQIWDAVFRGRRLTMGSMFEEPLPTRNYLATYGAFFLHCGATAMGNPGPEDRHPLHGELPNAPYRRVWLAVGRDGDGPFMEVGGAYRHVVAFTHGYEAQPRVKLGAAGGRVRLTMCIDNLRRAPMELMYLAHINFRPVDGARLIDTVPDDPRHMRVRTSVPAGLALSPAHRRLLEAVGADPALHRAIEPGRAIDPELVLALDCRADAAGWAHAMQLHPDGSADFVSHRPDELGCAVRWISRTGDEEALGLMLPATAEADGYTAEKAKGNLRVLPPLGRFTCTVAFGALDADEAAALRQRIETVMDGGA